MSSTFNIPDWRAHQALAPVELPAELPADLLEFPVIDLTAPKRLEYMARGSRLEGDLREAAEREWHDQRLPWLQYWHNSAERISAWPEGEIKS